MRPRTILIADDETELREMLKAYLEAEGFSVIEASTGPDTVEVARRESPDLVVLDIGMPGLDGFEVLQLLRSRSDVPVIMLTARSEETDRIVGLTAGADDYVTKPFSPRELSARIKAVLRRGRRDDPGDETLEYPGLSIDPLSRQVRMGEREVPLTTLEFDLLVALAASPGRVFTRDQLLQNVWGWDHFGVDRVVDVHIGSIRKALGDDATDPIYIGTVRGVGYRFVSKPL
ncbi:MAG: response regulator transcription factor [Actinobacteria bacterium]|nr:response regulator transcription factor [Actinomycetota bacterium]MBU1492870.1 response regulator transcription factor [Actinomycetota bacterium]